MIPNPYSLFSAHGLTGKQKICLDQQANFFYKIFTEHKKGQSVGSSCIFYVKVNKVVDSYFVFCKKKN